MVLIFADFDHESLTGWTFLQSTQDPNPGGRENSMAQGYVRRYDASRSDHKVERDPGMDLYALKHRDREALADFDGWSVDSGKKSHLTATEFNCLFH